MPHPRPERTAMTDTSFVCLDPDVPLALKILAAD